MNKYNIHPEIRNEFTRWMATIAYKNQPYSVAQDEAFIRTWNDCAKESNEFLLKYCPGLIPDPIEEIERELQLQEVLDDEIGDGEDDCE